MPEHMPRPPQASRAAGTSLNYSSHLSTGGAPKSLILLSLDRSRFFLDADVRFTLPTQTNCFDLQVMDFGVGIITPDWLKDATYLGEEPCGIYQ